MTTYTDRQKACIASLKSIVYEETGHKLSDIECVKILLHLESTSPITGFSEPDGENTVTCARMGHGIVAVGDCFSPEENEPGIVFMELPEARTVGADTTDVYPEGSRAENVLAYISFANAAAVDQVIEVLHGIKQKHWPDGGADVQERALLAAGQWADADTPISEALAYRDGFVAGAAPSQPAAPAETKPVSVDAGGMTFEQWAEDALEAHYDEHGSLVTYDKTSARLGWDAARASMPERKAGGMTDGAPKSVSQHAKSLVPLLQSFADRLRNDARSAQMFEADYDTLQDVIALCRSVVRSDRIATGEPNA